MNTFKTIALIACLCGVINAEHLDKRIDSASDYIYRKRETEFALNSNMFVVNGKVVDSYLKKNFSELSRKDRRMVFDKLKEKGVYVCNCCDFKNHDKKMKSSDSKSNVSARNKSSHGSNAGSRGGKKRKRSEKSSYKPRKKSKKGSSENVDSKGGLLLDALIENND